jgi:hypothetical protein
MVPNSARWGFGRGRITLAAAVLLAWPAAAPAQQIHRDSFESRSARWIKGTSDAPFRETGHDLTDATAHSGQHSEYIGLVADQGTYIHYVYPIGRAPVSDDLLASLWVRANRPGVQLMARLVLPRERDPKNPQGRLTTYLRGNPYQLVSRWERLELRNPVKLARDQQQFLRVELKRDVDFTDAYLDRLVLNVYGGPGQTEVWIDDLEVGPVFEGAPSAPGGPPSDKGAAPPAPRPAGRGSLVELRNGQLVVGGKSFFFRGIRHSDTPLKALRDAGFNTVWFDYRTPPDVVNEAVDRGFWVVPALPLTGDDPRLASPEAVENEAARWQAVEASLFYDLGGGLVEEQKESLRQAAKAVRAADPVRPLTADVWDGLEPYSNSLDLVGFHRWPLLTALELPQYRQWLEQRRLLTRPGSFTWTWVQTHLPDWYTTLVYERPGAAGFDEPIGPQPEQIRLLTYSAVAAGCRGLGFWSDRFLANTHQGRDRLLQLALLNLELQMLDRLLTTARPPRWIDTSIPEVKAAVIRTDHGILVLPMWLGGGGQFVPGQSAAAQLTMVVPDVPASATPWQITPAEVHTVVYERTHGGTRVTVPEFGLTAAVLFTSENNPTGIIVSLQDQVRRTREQAAHWNHDLAEVELEKVAKVEAQLEAAGHALPDGKALLEQARRRLRTCVDHFNGKDFRQAYEEAERVVRPLRILMRAQWEGATKGLDSAVASPYAVSFYTLPRHWQFMEPFRQATAGPNVLPGGGFETDPAQEQEVWTVQEARLDDVEMAARRVAEGAKEGKQCLMLEVRPRDAAAPPRGLERTFLAINSPAVRLPPGTPVVISGWVRIPKPVAASVDGALFYDSAGGEPLAVRLTAATPWKKFTLYRQVPASGTIHLTAALTGLGTAYFDDLRIEPVQGTRTALAPSGAARPLANALR